MEARPVEVARSSFCKCGVPKLVTGELKAVLLYVRCCKHVHIVEGMMHQPICLCHGDSINYKVVSAVLFNINMSMY
jgi:hypothetical protein